MLKRMIGLMLTDHIPAGECMLFVFPRPGYHGIWMKNMLVPIDVLWLGDDMVVLDMRERLEPCRGFCKVNYPRERASYVLELKAGEIRRNRIRRGTRIYARL